MITDSFASVLLASLISLSLPGEQVAPLSSPPPPPQRAASGQPAPATTRPAAPARTPAVRARAHGISFSGRVSSLDPAKKTLSVRDGAGREIALVWTAATKISGGDLKIGEAVTLRYLDQDTRHIAMTIKITPPPATTGAAGAHASAAPTPSPSLTPGHAFAVRGEGTGERLA